MAVMTLKAPYFLNSSNNINTTFNKLFGILFCIYKELFYYELIKGGGASKLK